MISCTAEHVCSGYGCGCRAHSTEIPSIDASEVGLELPVHVSLSHLSEAMATDNIHIHHNIHNITDHATRENHVIDWDWVKVIGHESDQMDQGGNRNSQEQMYEP